MRRLAVVGMLVVGLVVGAACGGGDDEPLGPTATVPQATTTTNPYAVPAVIDEAYVNRVLAGLDQVFGDAVRIVVASRTFPTDAARRVEAVYAGNVRLAVLGSISDAANSRLDNFEQPPSNQRTTASDLLMATPTCIFTEISRDYSGVTTDDDPPVTQWAVLRRAENFDTPGGHNPTGWVYVFDGVDQDGSAPEDPCAES